MEETGERRFTVAKGEHGEGLTWVVWVRLHEPTPSDMITMIKVTDATGRILHAGGMTGPPLRPGHRLSVVVDGSDEGPRALLARTDPEVRRAELTAATGATLQVPLHDCAAVPGVRFAALLVDRDLPLQSVVGLGEDGEELERCNLRLHQVRWEGRYRR